MQCQVKFLSTLSLRRATYNHVSSRKAKCISIHALLAESDPLVNMRNTLSPVFLSTLSLRRATIQNDNISVWARISIHALLAESDVTGFDSGTMVPAISIHALLAESDAAMGKPTLEIAYFYPRSPCGERRVHYDNYNLHCVISIHALLAESDFYGCYQRLLAGQISIHALLAESD